MFIEKEFLERWLKRIMERFDNIEGLLKKPTEKEIEKEKKEKERPRFEGEILYDNYDLCVMLNVSKRSLQRYRSLGWLKYKRIDQKTYYLQSEVQRFISEHFEKNASKTINK